MTYRHVWIQNRAYLSTKNSQLLIKQEEENRIPIEDIATIMLESHEVTVTTGLLSKLVEHGVLIYVCDQKHNPIGVYTSFQSHSRQSKVIRTQLNVSKPLTKRLWQKIIKQKIYNQAECLARNDKVGQNRLLKMMREVESGDLTNKEATAARYYFPSLFGHGFVRREESVINNALNYGYALFRGLVARSIVSYGFLPSIGLSHQSELNNFNLADDFLEPLRPYVDDFVFREFKENCDTFGPVEKKKLSELFKIRVHMNSGIYSITSAINIMLSSFVTSLNKKSYDTLLLPSWHDDSVS